MSKSKYINLINEITEQDKIALTDYITKYGAKKFIGIDTWLQNWSYSNQKLYKLLGNKLIHSFDIEYEKSEADLRMDFEKALHKIPEGKEFSFKAQYHSFYITYIKNIPSIDSDTVAFFNRLLNLENFVTGQISIGLKYKKPNAQKMLQIQAGAKILKAIGRVLEYFKDDFDFDMDLFEQFKKQYAIISTKKKIKTKACISIHPFDYITMSDNDSNWQSCMNWREEGCYHVGTIEMMNSNNVLCCYMINPNKPFVFDNDTINPETGELIGVWNNKTWRQLFYITKDIAMGGKAYPYRSKDITILILNEIKKLASENLHWEYQYGPELYQDMIHVNSSIAMETQRKWMRLEKKNPVKHNIIWDTKGMYNDMLNDNGTEYWCYRNKVNHTKIISASGKANCLCCNKDILIKSSYDDNDYNDRYDNTQATVCRDCLDENRCDYCSTNNPIFDYIDIVGEKMCSNCATKYLKICPCCGKTFYIDFDTNLDNFGLYYNDKIFNDETKKELEKHRNIYYDQLNSFGYSKNDLLDEPDRFDIDIDEVDDKVIVPLESLWVCEECGVSGKAAEKLLKEKNIPIKARKRWAWRGDRLVLLNIIDPTVAESYRYINLKKGNIEDFIEEIKKEKASKLA